MSETFFVTGATGFIGRRLVERLRESGKRVKCLTRPTSRRGDLTRLGVEFIEGDLSDGEALRRGISGCDGVFHCAGLTREMRSGDFLKVNGDGTRVVAELCAETSCPRLVALSSLAGAGTGVKLRANEEAEESDGALVPYRRREETDLPRPVSPYGRSKYLAEKNALEFASETSIVVLRPPYVFGDGDALSLELFRMVKKYGTITIPGYIDKYYSFVYVDDLTNAMTAAITRGERLSRDSLTPLETSDGGARCSGLGIYFPSNATLLRFAEFGTLIARAFGRRKVFPIRIPPVGALCAGVFGEISKRASRKYSAFDLNKAKEALRGPWVCSNRKTTRDLGVSLDSDLGEQLARTAKWYADNDLL